MKLGDESDGQMPIWVTTQDHKLGAITDGCKKCDIAKVWTNRFTKSNTAINHVPISEAVTLSNEDLHGTKVRLNVFDDG